MANTMLTAATEADALEALHELGCTDGLPVVVPTPDRVERMVLASALDPSLDLYADVILNPAFRADDFQRVQTQQIAGVQCACPDLVMHLGEDEEVMVTATYPALPPEATSVDLVANDGWLTIPDLPVGG